MINPLKISFYSPIANKTNFKSRNTLSLNHKDTLSFSGKKYVQENLLGEKILIPKAVQDAKRSSKRISVEGRTKKRSNGVFLGNDNLFLTTAHSFRDDYGYVGVGKHFQKENKYCTNQGDLAKIAPELDLSLIKLRPVEGLEYSKSEPVKFASSEPKITETVYILGSNSHWEGQKAIPARISEISGLVNDAKNYTFGNKATHYQIFSEILEKNKDRFSASGLSGSPVVNENGELVGILDRGKIDGNQGAFYIIDTYTINKFLSGQIASQG
jgi:hypothetical protein